MEQGPSATGKQNWFFIHFLSVSWLVFISFFFFYHHSIEKKRLQYEDPIIIVHSCLCYLQPGNDAMKICQRHTHF